MLDDTAAARINAVHGERGAEWLAALPRHLERLRERWRLLEVGAAFRGAQASFVAPVLDAAGEPRVIKVAPRADWAAQEAAALRHWAGHGAVRLVHADLEFGALLLERAVPGEDLVALCRRDDRAATAEAASVIAALREVRGAPPVDLPKLAAWVEALRPAMSSAPENLAAAWQRAAAIAEDLLHGADHTLLHGDLHHRNILTAQRTARLAVDPKGVIGPAEAEPAALLRNPRSLLLAHADPLSLTADRLDVLSERLGDDPRRVLSWAFVLAVLAAAWTFEDAEAEPAIARWLSIADVFNGLARRRRYG